MTMQFKAGTMVRAAFLGASVAAATLGFGAAANATTAPVAPNGSFGFIPFGTTTATTSGTWQIGPQTTSVTVPTSESVNTSTQGTSYLSNPDNLTVAAGPSTAVTLGYTTFSIPTLNVNTALGTNLSVDVTNSVGDILHFVFDHLLATSSGNGSLNLYWSGNFTGDSNSTYTSPNTASMSAAFTATQATAVGNASFSVATPPAPPPSVPEPASLALLASGLLGLGMIRRRA